MKTKENFTGYLLILCVYLFRKGLWAPTTRNFQDLSKAFHMKLAWSIRGSQTLDCIFQKKVSESPYGLLLPNLVVYALGVKSVLLSGNPTNT